MKLNHGEVVSLLGPSGCGKTTLLKLASGIEKLQEGEIILNNKTLKSGTDNSVKFYNKYINTSLVYKRNIQSSSLIETEISKILKTS